MTNEYWRLNTTRAWLRSVTPELRALAAEGWEERSERRDGATVRWLERAHPDYPPECGAVERRYVDGSGPVRVSAPIAGIELMHAA